VAAKDELGRWGEQLAAEHLEKRAGLTVLTRNWRCA
jgi:putative endonuclease